MIDKNLNQELPKVGIGWEIGLTTGWGIHGAYLMRRIMERGLAQVMTPYKPHMSLAHFQSPGMLGVDYRGPYPVVWAGGNPGRLVHGDGKPWAGDRLIQVFEQWDHWDAEDIAYFKSFGDYVITVSEWNAQVLREKGIKAKCVHLGVDTQQFRRNPNVDVREFGDRLVVFSAGKAEWRKGQDITLAAFRKLLDKVPNALLVTNWFNYDRSGAISAFAKSALEKPYIPTRGGNLDIHGWCEANGIPSDNHIDLGLCGRGRLAEVLRSVDVAIFAARCEGGTNMAAMECIAAGVPTFLSHGHGHEDLLRDRLGLRMTSDDPGEIAYQLKEDLKDVGIEHAERLRKNGWDWNTRMDAQIAALGLDTLNVSQRYFKPIEPQQVKEHAASLSKHFAQLRDIGFIDGAHSVIKRAYDLDPENPVILGNLGISYVLQNEFNKGRKLIERAGAMTGDKATLLRLTHNLALAHWFGGNFDDAEKILRPLSKGSEDAKWDFANLMLLRGRWAEGFELMEVRLTRKEMMNDFTDRGVRRWKKGDDIVGKTIWVTPEQGRGDLFQFARFLPELKKHCGMVILSMYATEMPLFYNYPGVDELRLQSNYVAKPDADLQVPLMSLPYLMGTTLENLPPDPGHFKRLRETFSAHMQVPRPTLKVGLVWAGNAQHKRDRDRSIPLPYLMPIVEDSNNTVFSMQVGDRQKDIEALGVGGIITDLSDKIKDNWHSTIGALSELDVLVTVDTAVAHMAGALDVPTFLLIPKVPDWRWLLGRNDTPWYPSVRLFRQTRVGDWQEPVERVANALRGMWDAARKNSQPTLR